MKKINKVAAFSLLFILTSCGGEEGLVAPSNFTFDLSTRAYSFSDVAAADTYQIVVEKLLNDATSESILNGDYITRTEQGQEISQYADAVVQQVTKPGASESAYVWTSPVNSTGNIKNTSGADTVTGNLKFYQFETQSDGVTPTLLDPLSETDPDEIPLGHYYISCYALDSSGNSSEAAWIEFTVDGQLAAPSISYSVEDGVMTVSVNSTYIDSAWRTEGLPESVDFTIDDGSGTTKTVSIDNWSYYSTVIGPSTSFNFMFLSEEVSVATADEYTVTAVARGDGGTILDSEETVVTGGTSGSSSSSSSGGDSSGGGMPGGDIGGNTGGDTGNNDWTISCGDLTFAEGAESFTVTYGSSSAFTDQTATLVESAEGVKYTYSFSNGDTAWPFDWDTKLALNEDYSAVLSWVAAGPMSAGSQTGTWSATDGIITVDF